MRPWVWVVSTARNSHSPPYMDKRRCWRIADCHRWLRDLDALRLLPSSLGRRIECLLAPKGGSRTWVSVTPFVPPRFVKQRGTNALIGQINAELASRGLPLVEELEELPINANTLALRHFIRRRQRRCAASRGYWLRTAIALCGTDHGSPDTRLRQSLRLGYVRGHGTGLKS
jgi:hypothetical protein